MRRLNKLQRRVLADSVAKLATYGLAGLIFVNVARPERISIGVTLIGVAACAGIFTIAILLVPDNDDGE